MRVQPIEENSTSVDVYYPNQLYDLHTLAANHGVGATTLSNVNSTTTPVSIMGGAVLPLRAASAMTMTALRATDFELVVAPALDGTAKGALYLNDGVPIEQKSTTNVSFADRKSTRLNSSHSGESRMPSSA